MIALAFITPVLSFYPDILGINVREHIVREDDLESSYPLRYLMRFCPFGSAKITQHVRNLCTILLHCHFLNIASRHVYRSTHVRLRTAILKTMTLPRSLVKSKSISHRRVVGVVCSNTSSSLTTLTTLTIFAIFIILIFGIAINIVWVKFL